MEKQSKRIDLTTLENLRAALARHGIAPSKRMSQNFLVDSDVLQEIVTAAELAVDDNVLEVGAGTGVLTQELAQQAGQIIAVEFDRAILPLLHEVVAPFSNVHLLQGDFLQLPLPELLKPFTRGKEIPPYKVVANIPYHITSRFLRKLLDAPMPPTTLTLLVQEEVAERITAAPGEMSLLSLSVQLFGQPSICARVPARAFWPAPKVDSAILHIQRYSKPAYSSEVRERIFRLARAGFSSRRKTFINAVSGSLQVEKALIAKELEVLGLSPTIRAQELSLQQWADLAERL
jgi:16S rRNA (adenine1518-N6/adenine1519-N6)-dimethyltransferase